MRIARFRQPALGALAVLIISGAGIAFAGSPSATPPQQPAATEAVEPAGQPAEAVEPAGQPAEGVEPAEAAEPAEPAGDTDTLQEGDQTTPDSQAEGAAETEKAGVEEPGDENLPGGGHADDPNDPNADHQFEGVE